MDAWRKLTEQGNQARREILQRKTLTDLIGLALEMGIKLPDIRWFYDIRQTPQVRRKQEMKYKNGIIDEIVKIESRKL